MIPNTDINCGKCATPIYSDCVIYSGKDLPCITLLQNCCDTDLTTVINLLGNYICSIGNIENYQIPTCLNSYSISDFTGLQNAIMEQLCAQNTAISVSGITWGCLTSGTTSSIRDNFQAIINNVSSQEITYASSQFVISGSSNACNQVLYLKQGEWVSFLPYKLGSISTTPITKLAYTGSYTTVEVSNGFSLATSATNPQGSNSQPQMYAYLDSLGYVTIVGTFVIGHQRAANTYSVGSGITSAYLSSGTLGTFANENGTGSIQMSSSGIYMKLCSTPIISGVGYYPGSVGIPGTNIVRAEVSTCGYGVNYDNQYYNASSGYPSGGTSFSANYDTCINYPTAYFPVYLTYNKNNSGTLDLYVQPSWNSNYKIPITLYVKITFNINN